jgi:tetratricopeptide (TPR) repeat protein
MKQFLLILLFSLSISAISQNDSIKSSIKELSFKIKHSQKAEKLKWMDSLTSLVINNSELKYDSIVRQTINYAKSLDSISNAGKHTANLIYYYNNVIGKPKEGLAVFQDFMAEYNKFDNNSILGLLYINTADSYYFIGEIETSIEYYNIAGNYALKNNDKRLLGLSNLYMGYSHSDLGQFSEASKRMKAAASFLEKLRTPSILLGQKLGLPFNIVK